MNKNWIILGIIVIIIIGFLNYQKLFKKENIPSFQISKFKNMEEKILNKKVVMVIAFRDFRDAEYFVPKEILENAGIEVKTASNKKGIAQGADGGEVAIDFLVSEVKANDFDAVIFVGGPGCLENLDNAESYRLIKETVDNGRFLAAICISPVILAKAGVLKEKNATVWSSLLDKKPIKILQEYGAIYKDQVVVVDGKIITANGPGAAKDFGEAIVNNLK